MEICSDEEFDNFVKHYSGIFKAVEIFDPMPLVKFLSDGQADFEKIAVNCLKMMYQEGYDNLFTEREEMLGIGVAAMIKSIFDPVFEGISYKKILDDFSEAMKHEQDRFSKRKEVLKTAPSPEYYIDAGFADNIVKKIFYSGREIVNPLGTQLRDDLYAAVPQSEMNAKELDAAECAKKIDWDNVVDMYAAFEARQLYLFER